MSQSMERNNWQMRIAICIRAEILKNYYFLFNYDLNSSNLTLSIIDAVRA
jgi:hypothetical protein